VRSLFRALCLLVVVSCAPQSADRGLLSPDGPSDAAGKMDRSEPDAAAPDRPVTPDAPVMPDTPVTPDDAPVEPPDAPRSPDAGDTPPPRTALLVVGDTALSVGDGRLRDILAVGLTVRLASDDAPVDVTGVDLVVLSESCASAALGNRYRDVLVPVVVLERASFPGMGMTGNTDAIDHGVTPGSEVNIQLPGHLMAAELTGTVAVVSVQSALGWGKPGPAAVRVAILPDLVDRVVIFGYAEGAAMIVGQALARRVGSFVFDTTAPRLNDNGVKLLAAAIDWALQ
jgi:hypothetical protein